MKNETIVTGIEQSAEHGSAEAEVALGGVRTITILMVPDAGEGWQEREIPVREPSEFMLKLPA